MSRTVPHAIPRPAQSIFIIKTSFVVETIALNKLYPNIHHVQPVLMYIETAIPKNIPAALCRHHPPYTASRPTQSVFIIKTSFVVQTIALNKLYPNIHHIQPVLMYIETAIPKNIPAALCRHHPPYTASRPAQSVFIIKTLFVVQTIALTKLYPNIHHMYLAMMYI